MTLLRRETVSYKEKSTVLQKDFESEIDRILAEKREQFRYSLKNGKVRFEKGMRALQRQQKTGVFAYLRKSQLKHLLTAPLIYSLIKTFA